MAAVTADRSLTNVLQGLGRAVILLGPPGAGKGTQAQRIAQRYNLPHLSTGDMFRDNIARETEVGRKAKPLLERGELVPDEIVLGMVEDRIDQPDCANGFRLRRLSAHAARRRMTWSGFASSTSWAAPSSCTWSLTRPC